jgi:sugar/nucleoside kinase (ribokinase family)
MTINDERLDCLVAGDANVDLIVNGAPDVEYNAEKLAHEMELTLGGSSSITAYNLARLGVKTGFLGVVGKDLFGDFVVNSLASANVNVDALHRDARDKTGLTIWLSQDMRRAGITYPGTIASLCSAHFKREHLQRARHLHVGHYFLLTRFHPDAAAVFRQARELGITTSLDCNYDPANQWDSHIHDVLRYTDIFFPNEEEACRLTGSRSAEAAAIQLGKLAGTIAVKRGAEGVLVYSNGSCFHQTAPAVDVVDTTGAGDSFNAGYLSQFLKSKNAHICADAGLAAAARCISRVGGTTAFEWKRNESIR